MPDRSDTPAPGGRDQMLRSALVEIQSAIDFDDDEGSCIVKLDTHQATALVDLIAREIDPAEAPAEREEDGTALAEALRQRDEATARAEKAEARIAELEDALRPFAAVGASEACAPHWHPRREERRAANILWSYGVEDDRLEITTEHVRRAARIMGAARHDD